MYWDDWRYRKEINLLADCTFWHNRRRIQYDRWWDVNSIRFEDIDQILICVGEALIVARIFGCVSKILGHFCKDKETTWNSTQPSFEILLHFQDTFWLAETKKVRQGFHLEFWSQDIETDPSIIRIRSSPFGEVSWRLGLTNYLFCKFWTEILAYFLNQIEVCPIEQSNSTILHQHFPSHSVSRSAWNPRCGSRL